MALQCPGHRRHGRRSHPVARLPRRHCARLVPLGKQKVTVAVERSILIAVWHISTGHVDHQALPATISKCDPGRVLRRIICQAIALSLTV